MQTSASPLPDLQSLTRGLASVLGKSQAGDGPVTVMDREIWKQGTFPKEIVTCRCGDGRELRLFCKYGSDETNHNCHGHRGGVAYEAAVYRQILQRAQTTTPRFYGAFTEANGSAICLILDYLDNGIRLARTGEPAAMSMAADWIGRFHAGHELSSASVPEPFLIAYDADYFLGWARRTDAFAGPLHRQFGWLATLCQRFEEVAALLLASPRTVIHGEYYPGKNILYSGGTIYPIDWESAAIGAGEIDLATLTEGWPADVVRECELQYARSRWPTGGTGDFERRLGAARLYLAFRWLGDEPDETVHESNLWRFEDLRVVGESLGLI